MKRYGLNKTTLIDYPGKVAATIFTRGCNMRCPYCHNPELISGDASPDMVDWNYILEFLKKRAHLLGGVCITGGEPLLHDDLGDRITEIHKLGLKVKIDTNGTLPDKLRNIKIDYIAMDLKTSLDSYHKLGYTGDSSELPGRIKESIRYIRESGIPHHFRTTVVPDIVTEEDIQKIIDMIEGEKIFVLQGFRPGVTLAPEWSNKPAPEIKMLESMKRQFEQRGISCNLR
ncbi:MAG: anaerobic ribonucleoside-triphosphate reductase activating protein [Spirochaetales bacterium]|nr:anaerobic ribonucleoside-triphosphate reductase activating protein [Spirochaetales bacterium]